MILVTGSLPFDYIMTHEDEFKNSIVPEKLEHLSVAFLVQNLRKHRGGTAGNIVYSLKLLDSSPLLMATAGYDFDDYHEAFHKMGINMKHTTTLRDEITASGFITSDKKGNQITMFYPGAMGKAAKKDLSTLKEQIKIAILAPEIPATVLHYAQECKKHDIPYLFDPGQNLQLYSRKELIEGTTGARGLIVNEYEWSLFRQRTGLQQKDVTSKAEMAVITRGEKGSTIYTEQETYEIPIFAPNEEHDPTGCGDAYRAGLLKGLSEELPLPECGKMAALAATYCLEEFGTQNHQYTWSEFSERIRSNS